MRSAGDVAKRFAHCFCTIVIKEALVAGAYSGRGARTVVAVELADRLANVFGVGDESITVVAAAAFGRHANSHLAGLAANRFADARVYCFVTVVTSASLRRRARAVNATLTALRPADKVRIELVFLVTVRALTNVRRYTVTVRALAFADRFARV